MSEVGPESLRMGVTAVMLPELSFEEQVELCVELGVGFYVYRPRVVPEGQRGKGYSNWGDHRFDLTPERLVKEGAGFAARLRDAGMQPYCTVPGGTNERDAARFAVDCEGAAAGGCSRIRLQPMGYPQGVFDYAAYLAEARGWLEEQVEIASGFGLKSAIEMHTGNSACSPGLAVRLVEGMDPERIGLIVDLPNFVREGSVKPGLGVSALGPYVDHAHVGGCRVTVGEVDELGFRKAATEFCGLEASDLDVRGWLDAALVAAPDAVWVIEDYTAGVSGAERLRATAGWVKRWWQGRG
ncbi:MAG: TIM barrel protein [Planctomycetota bacterium]